MVQSTPLQQMQNTTNIVKIVPFAALMVGKTTVSVYPHAPALHLALLYIMAQVVNAKV